MKGIETVGAILVLFGAILAIWFGVFLFQKIGIINFESAGDDLEGGDFEVRDCRSFIVQGCGMKASWEVASERLENIRFCTDYQRCVVGCAMLLELVDTGLSGNLTQGVYAINRELGAIYGVELEPSDFEFNQLAEDDFVEISKIAEVVKDATSVMSLEGNIQ